MQNLKIVTNKAADLIWMTGAGILEGKDPNLSLSSGLFRALAMEQPALRFVVLDIGSLGIDASTVYHESIC